MIRIKTPMSETLSRKFITIYSEQREKGYQGEQAIFRTLFHMQELIINFMTQYPSEINIINTAFENIKQDHSLHEKAMINYDLSKCDDHIRAKYMPFVSV